jgi:hypothetical protein
MSYERFSAGSVGWEDGSAADPSPGIPLERDPRIHEVLNEIEFLEQRKRPKGFTEQQWYELLKDLRHVAEKWLDIALACEWSLLDLFGSPPQLGGRVGLMGVAVLLRGRSIESIDHDRIIIASKIGAPGVYRRHSPGVSAPFDRHGAELIWDVLAKGQDR